MHELSLVESMMSSIAESAAENNIIRVIRVKLVVGRLNLAQPELLQFAFDALRTGTIFEAATLEIEERPLVMRCRKCGGTFTPDYVNFFCPGCGGQAEIVAGQELYIEHYEG
ncbi:MAG: hydrogenase maturation nickel metallochaperone HypA, partial [Thermoanaerobacteraceae bacterium]|nr:hydrogenase maturation nickel metallochaperone HypA [Thermoanaerobacteraceae bacterium]